MAGKVAVWLFMLASVSAMNTREVPGQYFEDYAMNNAVESGASDFDPTYPDYSDLDFKRHIVFMNLMRALQNNPDVLYRGPAQYDQNIYGALDIKGADEKRGSEKVKGGAKKISQKGTARPQPKWKTRKGKVRLCFFKICDFRRRP